MTPLVGPVHKAPCRGPLYGGLAGLFALSLHGAVAAFYLWQPQVSPPPEVPAAAPFVVELAMFMAAPENAAQDMPPGPEQVEAVKAPVTPPEVVEQELPELPQVERPAEIPIQKPVVAERPKPEREPDLEPEPDQPVEEYSEVSAPETSAPPSMNVAQARDVVTAPMAGAFNQQLIDAQQQWQHALQAHLERNKRSPREARRKGVSVVSFVMDREGRVLSMTLQQGSGVAMFDREALATIRRADPMPTPPAGVLRGETIALTLPIQFNM